MNRRLAVLATPIPLILATLISLMTASVDGAGTSAKAKTARQILRCEHKVDELSRVDIALEVGGDLKIDRSAKTISVPMSVVAQLGYDESIRQLSGDGSSGAIFTARHYDAAAATLKMGPTGGKPALRQDRRLVGMKSEAKGSVLFSPNGALTREELDLIDIPANSALIDRLLPEGPVGVGDTWKHGDGLAAALLGLEEVKQNDMSSELKEVVDGVARIQMSGRVVGTVGGAIAEMEVKAKYQYSFSARRINWVGLLVKENRKVGDVASGIDAVARLQMQITPLKKSANLTKAVLAGFPKEPSAELMRLGHQSGDGAWRLSHDRKWFVTTAERDLTVMRLMDGGHRVAQCNISTLDKIDPKKLPTLAEFQEDVRQALGKSFGQFVTAGQSVSSAQYREFRLVVDGQVEEVPVRWHYYLVADAQGRQVVFAFTIDGSTANRFNDADRSLVGTLRFSEPEVASRPASPSQPKPTGGAK